MMPLTNNKLLTNKIRICDRSKDISHINNSISIIKSLSSHIEVKTTSIYENYGSDIQVTFSHNENFPSISEDLKPQYVSLKVICIHTA